MPLSPIECFLRNLLMFLIYFLVWTKEELLENLMPIFEKIRNNDPEAGPFLDPVNPDQLGIPVSVFGICKCLYF